MDRKTLDQLWQTALHQSADDGEQYTRYHFVKMVAEYVIKYAPDYEMGYADGVAVEREACAKVCEDIERMSQGAEDAPAYRYYEAIRARGNT